MQEAEHNIAFDVTGLLNRIADLERASVHLGRTDALVQCQELAVGFRSAVAAAIEATEQWLTRFEHSIGSLAQQELLRGTRLAQEGRRSVGKELFLKFASRGGVGHVVPIDEVTDIHLEGRTTTHHGIRLSLADRVIQNCRGFLDRNTLRFFLENFEEKNQHGNTRRAGVFLKFFP